MTQVNHRQALAALKALANPEKAAFFKGFFKTGKGQYGEGDRFLGLAVPAVRRLSRTFRQLPRAEVERLLGSPYNEARLLALLILVEHYRRGDARTREAVYQCYVRNRRRVNNWNLVDASAPYIVGVHLLERDRARLRELAASECLWERRIAVLATFAFIRAGDFTDTLELTRRLLTDREDLMHKACGWMLREIGKRGEPVLRDFLHLHRRAMPRTMLRYAIERFPPAERRALLA